MTVHLILGSARDLWLTVLVKQHHTFAQPSPPVVLDHPFYSLLTSQMASQSTKLHFGPKR
ncbi:hypothetical protein C0J52_23011 [Blattella germanica]|nr:hypothetical protein C0J52_23011 [Blattella germanica]